MSEPMKPWQRVVQTCGRCDTLAELTVTHHHYDGLLIEDLIGLRLSGEAVPEVDRLILRFACAVHYDEVMDQVLECCGYATGNAVRYSWWYWITSRARLGHSAVGGERSDYPND